MAVIQHLALPVMMVVILCASFMFAPVDAMSHTGTSTAAPSSELPIKNYIARVVYWKLTETFIGRYANTDHLAAISKDQIQRIQRKRYDISNNQFLASLLQHDSVSFQELLVILSPNYGLMEAALRVCVDVDEWRMHQLNDYFPKSIADHAIGELGLRYDTDHVSSSQLAKALESYVPSRGNN